MKGVLVAVGLGAQAAHRPLSASASQAIARVQPPIDLAIEAFARSGFDEVCVVLGHNEDVLWRYLEDGGRYDIVVYCAHNAQHGRGSATAIYAARTFVGGEPFVVSLSGYHLTARMLLDLMRQSRGAHALCVERRGAAHSARPAALRVCLDEEGHVRRIGRRLRHWHAQSTGAFLFQPDVFGHIADLLLAGDGDCSITALLRRMLARGQQLYVCDASWRWRSSPVLQDPFFWTTPILSARITPECAAA